jgi:adenylyltransferase/sulfurtransferase
LGQIASRRSEIDPSRETIVYCKVGLRSAAAVYRLKQAGFPGRLINLKGGILAWSKDVDPSVPKY